MANYNQIVAVETEIDPQKLYRLTFTCPDCEARHQGTGPAIVVFAEALKMLMAGAPSVLVEDEVVALINDADEHEAKITDVVPYNFPAT